MLGDYSSSSFIAIGYADSDQANPSGPECSNGAKMVLRVLDRGGILQFS